MRLGAWLVVLGWLGTWTLAGQPYAPAPNPLYDDTVVATISIDIAREDLNFLYAAGNEDSDLEFPATFTFDNGTIQEVVENVGFRLRGNTSRLSAKKSFRVSFNTFEPGRKLYGIEKLNLNGEHNDPSIMRTKLSWDLFAEMGVPASRANHVRVYINGTYYGLYINVENIDEQFLQSRFRNDEGSLYKCLWPADLAYLGPDADAYRPDASRRPYDLKLRDSDDEGYDDLAAFIDLVNNTSPSAFEDAIENAFDVNGFLRALAVTVATGSWDTYAFLKNNFYLYFNPETGKVVYIPFDFDNSFGIWWEGIWPGIDWANRNVYVWQHPTEQRPLVKRILQVQTFRERFTFYVRHLMGGAFDPAVMNPRIDALLAAIGPAAEEDTFRRLDYEFSVDDFYRSYDEPLGRHVTYGLKPFIEQRRTTALAQLDAGNIAPILSDGRHLPQQPRPEDPIRFLLRVEDEAANPDVQVRIQVDGSAEQVVPLFDDGQHRDEAAGDGIYGGTLPAIGAAATVTYTLEATDAVGQISTAAPQTITVGSSNAALVLNEFMASNDATLADPAGEFDDWIELHNSGTTAVNVGGMFLTDNFRRPSKWALPDTTIQPGGFLLVWADEDGSQGPLHANFRLDREGEEVGLFDANFLPVDQLTYDSLGTDVAFGRVPDGTGPFSILAAPTPGAANAAAVANERLAAFAETIGLHAWPNPFAEVQTLAVTLPQPGRVTLAVYDVLGRRVREVAAGVYASGTHQLSWDATAASGQRLSTGMYWLRLIVHDAGGHIAQTTRAVTLLR